MLFYNLGLYSVEYFRFFGGLAVFFFFFLMILSVVGLEGVWVCSSDDCAEEMMLMHGFLGGSSKVCAFKVPGSDFLIVPVFFLFFELNTSCFLSPSVCFCTHLIVPLTVSFPVCMSFLLSSLVHSPMEFSVSVCPMGVPEVSVFLVSVSEIVSMLMRFFVVSLRMSTNLLIGAVVLVLEWKLFIFVLHNLVLDYSAEIMSYYLFLNYQSDILLNVDELEWLADHSHDFYVVVMRNLIEWYYCLFNFFGVETFIYLIMSSLFYLDKIDFLPCFFDFVGLGLLSDSLAVTLDYIYEFSLWGFKSPLVSPFLESVLTPILKWWDSVTLGCFVLFVIFWSSAVEFFYSVFQVVLFSFLLVLYSSEHTKAFVSFPSLCPKTFLGFSSFRFLLFKSKSLVMGV